MTNLEKYNEAFKTVFSIENADLEDYTYQATQAWDSVGHIQLIAELEETFDIMMDADDIIDFSSYKKGKEILKKYEIEM